MIFPSTLRLLVSNLFNSYRCGISRRRLVAQSFRPVPSTETLETRALLAAFVVTSADDAGAGTLRQAIEDADANDEADTISFDLPGAGDTTIALDSQLDITAADDLSIDAAGDNNVTISNASGRVFYIDSAGGNVSLANMTLTGAAGADEDGGAIQSVSNNSLQLDNVSIENSTASVGGAISMEDGNLHLLNSSVTGNTAGDTGAIRSVGGDVEVTGSSVEGNEATEYGPGGIQTYSGKVTLTDSSVSGNTGSDYGSGGIYSYSGDVTLSGSSVSGNMSGGDGGAVYTNSGKVTVTNSTLSNNTTAAGGGGVYSYSGAVDVTDSTIAGNQATEYGGGIHANEGNVTITNSTISGNTAAESGGIRAVSGILTVTRSTLSGNTANEYGGAISAFSGSVTVTASTISGNTATAYDGGGIYSDAAAVTISNSTITANDAGESGGGIFMGNRDADAPLTIIGSIVANNTSAVAAPDLIPDPDAVVTVEYSLVGDNTDSGLNEAPIGSPDASGSLIGTSDNPIDPDLGPLQNNGGTTETHALLPGSPAIDGGISDGLVTDQIGTVRTFEIDTSPNPPGGDGADMGSFELLLGDISATAFDADVDHVLNAQTDVTFTVENTGVLPIGAFDTHIVWSPNDILGDFDDVVVSNTLESFTGLGLGASETRTVSVVLNRGELYDASVAADPAGQPVGTVSNDVTQLFLVVDVGNLIPEAVEANNAGVGLGVDSDDITYFGQDVNGSGVVTPLEARDAIANINTPNAVFDLDGNGLVTPLDALRVVQTIGLERNPVALDDAPVGGLQQFAGGDSLLHTSTAVAVSGPGNAVHRAQLFEQDESDAEERVIQTEEPVQHQTFSEAVDWLDVI